MGAETAPLQFKSAQTAAHEGVRRARVVGCAVWIVGFSPPSAARTPIYKSDSSLREAFRASGSDEAIYGIILSRPSLRQVLAG